LWLCGPSWRDGETRQHVLALLGRSYSVCTTCAPQTLIYPAALDDPGAIVERFQHGTLASHFLIRVKIAE